MNRELKIIPNFGEGSHGKHMGQLETGFSNSTSETPTILREIMRRNSQELERLLTDKRADG